MKEEKKILPLECFILFAEGLLVFIKKPCSGLLKIIRKEPKTESRNILLATYGSIKGL